MTLYDADLEAATATATGRLPASKPRLSPPLAGCQQATAATATGRLPASRSASEARRSFRLRRSSPRVTQGAARLARALHVNKSLLFLNLSLSRLGTNAGIAFAEALRATAPLPHASLAGNLLTDAATVALAAALAGNKTITHLDLARNTIHAIGAQALRQALHSNKSLTSLGNLEALPVAVPRSGSNRGAARTAERLEPLTRCRTAAQPPSELTVATWGLYHGLSRAGQPAYRPRVVPAQQP